MDADADAVAAADPPGTAPPSRPDAPPPSPARRAIVLTVALIPTASYSRGARRSVLIRAHANGGSLLFRQFRHCTLKKLYERANARLALGFLPMRYNGALVDPYTDTPDSLAMEEYTGLFTKIQYQRAGKHHSFVALVARPAVPVSPSL